MLSPTPAAFPSTLPHPQIPGLAGTKHSPPASCQPNPAKPCLLPNYCLAYLADCFPVTIYVCQGGAAHVLVQEAEEAVRVSEEGARERQAQLAALEQQLSLERARAAQLQVSEPLPGDEWFWWASSVD